MQTIFASATGQGGVVPVVLSDTEAVLIPHKAIHSNSDGVVRLSTDHGKTSVNMAVVTGGTLNVRVTNIYATGTTATDLVFMNWE